MAGATTAAMKWKERVGQSGKYYKAGTEGAVTKFDAAVGKSADAYREGIMDALNRDAYSRNVAGKGSKWAQKVREKGESRWGEGVSKGESDYQREVQPFIDALQSADYGPTGAKGSQANMDRQKRAVQIARDLKLSRSR